MSEWRLNQADKGPSIQVGICDSRELCFVYLWLQTGANLKKAAAEKPEDDWWIKAESCDLSTGSVVLFTRIGSNLRLHKLQIYKNSDVSIPWDLRQAGMANST